MLSFPNCKINLGLHVLSKRSDGYHALETVFYPISWCDALEVIENKENTEVFRFSQSGLVISGPIDQNLIYKTWKLIQQSVALPPLKVHLHKSIPMGAGLGGGSSDAAFFINLIDSKFNVSLSPVQKTEIAKQIGSDCAFFIHNTPVYAEGKGDQLSEIAIDLSQYYILVIYPNIQSNTAEAYAKLQPKIPKKDLRTILKESSIHEWKNVLVNDFEETIFLKYPAIAQLKNQLYEYGALYSSMSGSGSAVYGIFTEKPKIELRPEYSYYLQKPLRNIL